MSDATAYGGSERDFFRGSGTMYGEGGNDFFYFTNGSGWIALGGDGDDTFDALIGGVPRAKPILETPDTFNIVLDGDDGNDKINGTVGSDHIIGGSGDDVISSLPNRPLAYIQFFGGGDLIEGGIGSDILRGIGILDGGADNDKISGYGTLLGGAGADRILGELGTVHGGDGDDTIALRKGQAFGDAGADTFLLTDEFKTRVIADFNFAEGDRLDVDFAARVVDDFTGVAGEVRAIMKADMVRLQFDEDGDGKADFAADLLGNHAVVDGFFV